MALLRFAVILVLVLHNFCNALLNNANVQDLAKALDTLSKTVESLNASLVLTNVQLHQEQQEHARDREILRQLQTKISKN